MLLTLEPLQAQEGDCLLLHWGTQANPNLAVIDGGPGQVWEDSLKPRLEEILKKRKLTQLPIELVMVSHMDSDHVIGVKKAFREWKKAVEKKLPAKDKPFDFRRLWHNVFNDILGDAPDAYYKGLTASLSAGVGGKPDATLVSELEKELAKTLSAEQAAHAAWEMGLILAGHLDGRDLRIDHEYLFKNGHTLRINDPFVAGTKATLITADDKTHTVAGLDLQVVGPSATEIAALQKEFDKAITDAGLTASTLVAAYADTSKKNLSSIVCMVTLGGKRILLTGDARGDKILAGLTTAKFLKNTDPLHVDVLKVPHHGSDRNASADFFKRITADHYVFSGDGKHGNPERETLQWVIDSRKKTDQYHLYFTYPIKEVDPVRKDEHEKNRKKPNSTLPPWDDKKHSLKSFFADLTGHKFVVHEGAPFKIDLGDESIAW